MTRRGQIELSTLVIMLFIGVAASWGNMISSSLVLNDAIQQQMQDFAPEMESGLLTKYMEDQFMPPAMNYSTLEGGYVTGMCGPGSSDGIWTDDGPSEGDVETHLETNVGRVFARYIDSLGAGGGCRLEGLDEFAVSLDEEDPNVPFMNYSFQNVGGADLSVACSSREQRLIVANQDTTRSLEIMQLMDIPEFMEAYGTRYLNMFDLAKDIVTDPDWEDAVQSPGIKSSHFAVKDCDETGTADCDLADANVQFSGDGGLENEQEIRVAENFLRALQYVVEKHIDDYDDLEVEFKILEIEFEPVNIEEVYYDTIPTGCAVSDTEQYTTYDEICGGDCPSDDPYPFDRSHDYCTECSNYDSLPKEHPGDEEFEEGHDTWTEDPWRGSCDPTTTDPFGDNDWELTEPGTSPSGSSSPTGGITAAQGFNSDLRPVQETSRPSTAAFDGGGGGGGGDTSTDSDTSTDRERGPSAGCEPNCGDSDGDSGDDDDEPSCEPDCDSDTHTAVEKLYYTSNSKGAWEFDLEVTIRVRVIITDTDPDNTIPTSQGYMPPRFSFIYEDEFTTETGSASQDIPLVSGNVEEWNGDGAWSQASLPSRSEETATGGDNFEEPPAPPETGHDEPGTGSRSIDFTIHEIASTGGSSMGQTSLVDVDKDGDLDFISGEKGGGDVYWFEYRAADDWVQHTIGSGADTDVAGVAFDINGDGWVDQLSGGVWYRNPGNPRSSEWDRFGSGAIYAHDHRVGDIDGDGAADDVVSFDDGSGRGLYWHHIPSDPTNSWQERRIESPSSYHGGVAIGDLDGDGDEDISLVDRWFENNGDGTSWTEHQDFDFGQDGPFGIMTSAEIVDLDGDGDQDLVQAEGDIEGGRVAWFENGGGGNDWTRHIIKSGGHNQDFHSICVEDFDRDGDLDVFSGGGPLTGGEKKWFVWENTGGGDGWTEHEIASGYATHEARCGDVDGDGDIDIATKGWNDDRHVFAENVGSSTGSGSWTSLFNGENLDGWETRGGSATFTAQDGTIVGESDPSTSLNTFLTTQDTYGDFELRFETRLSTDYDGFSGVQVRSGIHSDDELIGPQVEIESSPGESGYIYGENMGTGWLSTQETHSLFNNGEWNQFQVRAEGDTIQSWINGEQVADLTDSSIDSSGRIGLQVHRADDAYTVEWRNIEIRELDGSSGGSGDGRLVFDWTGTKTYPGNGKPYAQIKAEDLPFNDPWAGSPNYADGTLHMYLKIHDVPSPQAMKFQFVIHQIRWDEREDYDRAIQIQAQDGGEYTWSTPISELSQPSGDFDPVDYADNPSEHPGSHWDRGVSIKSGGGGWASEDAFPLEFTFKVVSVPEGGTFGGWDSYVD